MPVSRKTHDDLRFRYRDALIRRNAAERKAERLETDIKGERAAHADTRRALVNAEAEIERLTGQNERLSGLMKTAQQDQGAEVAQLTTAHEAEVNQLRKALAEARRPRLLPPGNITQLDLSERARKSLDEQIAVLQASNEAMSRELVDRSGILKVAQPTGREPGLEAKP
ncbi:hypothetical protein [Streptomyces sp. NPDC053079]|uniref:hypothetical protein n=1 Tax=Streptomyces sp. NPDC053079 TaxID=3365697 RepID=UPI0037CD2F22